MKLTLLTIALTVTPLSAQQMDHSNMPGMQMPGDAQHPSTANKPAMREAQSLRNSEAQQQAQPSQAAPSAQSITRDVQHLQEAENPAARTGSDRPAPGLLTEAASRQPISLDQWQQWATAHNPTLRQAQAVQQQSQQLGRQAAMLPNPTIGYSGEHIRGGSYGGGEQGAFVQQTIVLGNKLGLRSDVYKQQAAADATAIEEQALRIRADVSRAFYRALAAQSIAATRTNLLHIAQQASSTAHAFANLGQVDSTDVLQSEIELEQARMDFSEAQRTYIEAFRILASIAAQPDQPVAPLTGDLLQAPDLDTNQAVAKILTDSPSIKHAQQEQTVAEARIKSERRATIPDLTIQAGEWHSGEQLNGSNKPAGWMGFAQAGIQLPLWNRNQGGIAAAQAQSTHAQAEVTRTQLQLRSAAEPLAQRYLNARSQAQRYRDELLPRAQRIVELTNMKYQQMAAPYPQTLTAQRTLAQLQLAYTRALEEEWMDAIGLQTYTLTGSLDRTVGVNNNIQNDTE
jgi:cobalt-zinc-cadmium efflux system outer membrane protein